MTMMTLFRYDNTKINPRTHPDMIEKWQPRAKASPDFMPEQAVKVMRLKARQVSITWISALLRMPYAAVIKAIDTHRETTDTIY
jgi:hypothetical protein